MNTRRLLDPFVLAIAIASAPLGCARNTVMPYGPGRFTVSYSTIKGVAEARNAALRDANEHCAKQRRQMVPLDEQVSEFRNRASFALVFSCR